MGRKLLIMPPYRPVEYHGDMEREIGRRSDMYRDADMRIEPYDGGRYDRRGYTGGMMRMGGSRSYPYMGGYGAEMRMDEPYYDDPRYNGGMGPDMRRGRDSRGRYTSARMGGYDEPWMGGDDREQSPEMGRAGRDNRVYFPRMSHKIGFSVDGEMERLPEEVQTDYRTTAGYEHMDEMKPRKGTSAMSGRADSSGYAPFNKEMAMEWTRRMENADGSMGPHWTMDQVKKVMAQHNVECDPAEFYAAMNATFSDLAPFFKKYNISNMDAYVDYVKMFWLDDKDAPDKVAKYYQCIVE